LGSSYFSLPVGKQTNVNIECQYPYEDPIEVFAFRTHAHTNGQVITGYRKRWRFISAINCEIIEEEKYTYTPAVYKTGQIISS
jgi:hypothetical protein